MTLTCQAVDRPSPGLPARDAAGADGLVAYLQPIVNLGTGEIAGFELLARLREGKVVLSPAQFLHRLTETDRLILFTRMLGFASAVIAEHRARWPDLYVSVNIEASLLLREDFCALVAAAALPRGNGAPVIYLELLESERIGDIGHATANLHALRAMGIGISLDDVGSAYSSLMLLKRLPIDTIKLDQAFARELAANPEGLQFVHSVMSLARGLGCKLIVEGIETGPILDAVGIMGVPYGQGYAIARPMPASEVAGWLAAHVPKPRSRVPRSMLGAYAAHLNLMQTCRILAVQPLPLAWTDKVRDPHACGIGMFFDSCGLHDTPVGVAHQLFHEVIHLSATEEARWAAAAEVLRLALQQAIAAEDACSGPVPQARCACGVGSA